MNFTLLLLEFLKKQDSVSIPGFGTFYLHTINAVLDREGKNILPPGTEIAFKIEILENKNNFAEFLSQQKNIPIIDAEIEIKKHVNHWNLILHKDKKIELDHLGTLSIKDNQILFWGHKTDHLSPDFYGLEEINISKIKNSISKTPSFYRMSTSVFAITALVIGIVGITYLGITQPEMIFGKKSFKEETPKKGILPLKKDLLKKDSLSIIQPVTDSITNDSLQKTTAPVITPAKKWSSKNNSKPQWKNQKKQ